MDSREALEAAVRARPGDVQARLVLGDLLQQQGDLAGELVTLQHEMERDHAKRLRAEQFIEANRSALLGGLPVSGVSLEWFVGSIRKASILPVHTPARIAGHLDRLPGLTVGRFIEELELELEDGADPAPVFASLAQPGFESLRRLKLSGGRPSDFSPVWRALPALESLELSQQKLLGEVSAPALRALSLTVASESTLDALTAGGLSLERLSLTLTAIPPESICALVGRQKDLRALSLTGPAVTDALCTGLARLPSFRALKRLSLTGGTLTIAGARTLASAGLKLEHLDVSENHLEPTTKAVLMRICPGVKLGQQEHDGAVVEPVLRAANGWVVLDKPNADPDLPMRAAAMLGKHHGVRALVLEVTPQVELAAGKVCTVVRLLGLGDKSFKLDEFAESLGRRTESLRRAERYKVLCLHHVAHTSAAWRLFGTEGKLAEGAGAQAEVVSDGLQQLLEAAPPHDFLERLDTAGELRSVIWNHAPAPGRPVEGTRDAYPPFATMDIDFAPPEEEPNGDEVIGECSDCRAQAELWECEDCREEFCGDCLTEPADRTVYVCRGCAQGGTSGEHYVED
ncbi:MAG: TIGR02996 domain-containing protein [Myxococcaceae bacterium]